MTKAMTVSACPVCGHPDAIDIDAQLLLEAAPAAVVAAEHDLDVSAVINHRDNHLRNRMAKVLSTTGVRSSVMDTAMVMYDALEAQTYDVNRELMITAQIDAMMAKAGQWLDNAESGRDAALVMREMREIIALQLRIMGVIADGPKVAMQQVINNRATPPDLSKLDDAEVLALRDLVAKAGGK